VVDVAPESRVPFPLPPRTVAGWSSSRSNAFDQNPAGNMAVYHTPEKGRLPGWTPNEANLAVVARLVDQPGGEEIAENLEGAMYEFVGRLPVAEQGKVLVVPAKQIHLTIAYVGLAGLCKYDETLPADPKEIHRELFSADDRPTPKLGSILRAVARDHDGIIQQLAAVARDAEAPLVGLRGIQAVPNAFLFRALGGGGPMNELTAKVRDGVPSLLGNDPTISPVDKNATGQWGMAAHVTGALLSEPLSNRLAAYLMHTPGRGVAGKADFLLTTLELAAQTYQVVRNGRGQEVGGPFQHATVAKFELGGGLVAGQGASRGLSTP
jgi:hypothetical protein